MLKRTVTRLDRAIRKIFLKNQKQYSNMTKEEIASKCENERFKTILKKMSITEMSIKDRLIYAKYRRIRDARNNTN